MGKLFVMVFMLVSAIGYSQTWELDIPDSYKQAVMEVLPAYVANKVVKYKITWADSLYGEGNSNPRAWTDSKSYIAVNNYYYLGGLSKATYLHEVFHTWILIKDDVKESTGGYSIDRIRVMMLDQRLEEEQECNLFAEAVMYGRDGDIKYFNKFHPELNLK